MTKTKYSVPWIDVAIKRRERKRHKLYLRARKSKDLDVKIPYKRFRAHVQKVQFERCVLEIRFLVQELIFVWALVFDLAQLTCQKRFSNHLDGEERAGCFA